MGLFSNIAGQVTQAAAPPLAPVGRPIGVIPAFTQHQQQMALKVREKKMSFTGDDFAVKDAVTGQKIFSVDGKMMSLHARKDIYDARGEKLFTLKKKLIALHATFEGSSPSDQELFTIKGGFGFGAKLTITFKNLAGGGEDTKLRLKGDWFDRKATITTENDVPVAHISRSFMNAGQILFDDQTYVLTVAPGVDASLMLAVCVCLDETENDKEKK